MPKFNWSLRRRSGGLLVIIATLSNFNNPYVGVLFYLIDNKPAAMPTGCGLKHAENNALFTATL